jgi:hypothetical protein
MGFLPIYRRAASLPHPLCPWVLRAVPDKCCGARRGKRDKMTLLFILDSLVEHIPALPPTHLKETYAANHHKKQLLRVFIPTALD